MWYPKKEPLDPFVSHLLSVWFPTGSRTYHLKNYFPRNTILFWHFTWMVVLPLPLKMLFTGFLSSWKKSVCTTPYCIRFTFKITIIFVVTLRRVSRHSEHIAPMVLFWFWSDQYHPSLHTHRLEQVHLSTPIFFSQNAWSSSFSLRENQEKSSAPHSSRFVHKHGNNFLLHAFSLSS